MVPEIRTEEDAGIQKGRLIMTMLEKVEMLRERADVTYEEAKNALEESDGDLLDAMVLLERMGKVKKPEQGTYSTGYEEQAGYVRVQDKVDEQRRYAPHPGQIVGKILRKVLQILRNDSFCVERFGSTLFMMPAWLFAIVLFFSWRISLLVMIASLFFGVRYRFVGDDDLTVANDIMDKAGSLAEDVSKELRRDKER